MACDDCLDAIKPCPNKQHPLVAKEETSLEHY